MANVDIYLESKLSAADVLEFGFDNIAIATGSNWRNDGSTPIYTPDDLMAGNLPSGKVLIFDDDHYYMGSVLAQLMTESSTQITLVTPSAYVSD